MARPDRQAPKAPAAAASLGTDESACVTQDPRDLGAVGGQTQKAGQGCDDTSTSTSTSSALKSMRSADNEEGGDKDDIQLRTLKRLQTSGYSALPEICVTEASPISPGGSVERERRSWQRQSQGEEREESQIDGVGASSVPTRDEADERIGTDDTYTKMAGDRVAEDTGAPEMTTMEEAQAQAQSSQQAQAQAQTMEKQQQQDTEKQKHSSSPGATDTVTKPEPAHLSPQSSTSSSPDPVDATTSAPTKPANPTLSIALLLPTGTRHSFRITESYLTKRSISIPGTTDEGKGDPYSISVYQLKELILREWRGEWTPKGRDGEGRGSADDDGRPTSPGAIRLIFFGRLLEDGVCVGDCRFNQHGTNVVHMAIRPNDIVEEEETERKRNERSMRDDQEDTPGCRCVLM